MRLVSIVTGMATAAIWTAQTVLGEARHARRE
jgi:hypothetical protein